MADPPPCPGADEPGDDTGARPDRSPTTGAPRWVLGMVIVIAIVLVLLIVVSHLSGVVGPGAH